MNPAPLSIREIAQLEFEIFGQVLKYGIFRTCKAHVDQWDQVPNPQSDVVSIQSDITSLDLQLYGAQVVKRMSSNIPHVIYDPVLAARTAEWKRNNRLQWRKFH